MCPNKAEKQTNHKSKDLLKTIFFSKIREINVLLENFSYQNALKCMIII